jgi:hypothetical protein
MAYDKKRVIILIVNDETILESIVQNALSHLTIPNVLTPPVELHLPTTHEKNNSIQSAIFYNQRAYLKNCRNGKVPYSRKY